MASWKGLRRSWETFSTLCSGHGVGDGIELLVDTRLVVKMLREMKIIWRWCRCSIGTPTHQYLLWDTDGGFIISNETMMIITSMTIRCKIKETYDCETNWESSNFWQFSQISPKADWAIVCQSPSAQTSLWGFYPFSQLRQLISFFMIFPPINLWPFVRVLFIVWQKLLFIVWQKLLFIVWQFTDMWGNYTHCVLHRLQVWSCARNI